jgi:hypothetical protein
VQLLEAFKLEETRVEGERVVEIEAAPGDDSSSPVMFKVENYIAEDVKVFYSDAMIALHTENEFILSFLQTEFPVAQGTEELRQVKTVRRKCMVQIIVNPKQAEAILRVLQENVDRHAASQKK